MEKIDIDLLTVISTEIYRDGGASLVRDLKDYNPQINTLLKKRRSCTTAAAATTTTNGSTLECGGKLLRFIEMHSIFEVDRDSLPHVVYLLSDEYVYCNSNVNNTTCNEQQQQQRILEAKKMILKDRIICVLKKEKCKNDRRSYHKSCLDGVSLSWLLKQCKNQLHHYLRLVGFYQRVYSRSHPSDVKLVGSPHWSGLVKEEFISILREKNEHYEYKDDDDRVFLKEEQDGDRNADIDVKAIASKLADKVEKDGGTHISLSLLLHRNADLRNLLSGYDLIQLKRENEICFNDLNIFKRNNEVFIQSQVIKEGRMEVDETGLFSVASSKWGNAFASFMANHCKSSLSSEVEETIAIDLTASVGGVTLPLAKIFKKVIAIEIDENRAALCHRNMVKFGVAERVQILNRDSVEVLPIIAKGISCPKVVIIDPPWGGKYYKQDKEKEIMMGEWSMIEVIKRISDHLCPCVTGLRMPVSFNYTVFFQSLKDFGVAFDILEVKKAGPQLFVMLKL